MLPCALQVEAHLDTIDGDVHVSIYGQELVLYELPLVAVQCHHASSRGRLRSVEVSPAATCRTE